MNMFHPLCPPPAGDNKLNTFLTGGENKRNLVTPKALNMDNPVQAAGAARGRNGIHTLSGAVQKVKNMNRKERKGFSQRTQSFEFAFFFFAYFAKNLCAFAVKTLVAHPLVCWNRKSDNRKSDNFTPLIPRQRGRYHHLPHINPIIFYL